MNSPFFLPHFLLPPSHFLLHQCYHTHNNIDHKGDIMTARQTGILLLLGAIWGAAFMLIKIAVSDVAPATLVAVRIAITAVILTRPNL